MAFKVRTEVRPATNAGVTVSEIPGDFLAAMDAEYAAITADPTREIVIAGETAPETTLYVQYAKAWGIMHEPKLSVTKLPPRKTDNALDARLGIVDAEHAPKRGKRKPATPAPAIPATAPAPAAAAKGK